MTHDTATLNPPPSVDGDDADDDNARPWLAEGSEQRLAVLMHLAKVPRGAHISSLSQLVSLEPEDTRRLLRSLQRQQRVDCDRAGPNTLWYSPYARAAAQRGTRGEPC